jgi:hypothetical protein
MATDLRRVLDTLAEFGPTFDKTTDNPNVTPIIKSAGMDDANGSMPSMRKVLSMSDRILMQKELTKLDTSELVYLFGEQLKKADRGVPIGNDPLLSVALGNDPVISKVLDTTGGAALQRQDLEPLLWAIN